MTLIIPTRLRRLVEGYVIRGDRHLEKGGYLIGRQNTITAFLPVPNTSDGNHATSYQINQPATIAVARELAKMVASEVIGDLHTHPNGTVPSEQDGRYVSSMPWPYHVILSDKGSSFDWYCVDGHLKGVGLVDSDAQLEGIMEIVAGELNLRDLGQFFLTPGGEVISTRKEGLRFITVDEDAIKVEEWWRRVKAGPRGWQYKKTIAECQRGTGLPASRIKVAFRKLGWMNA